ncbi:MAG: 30S ribosome-binding factor RbfA [Bryobacterales bacterium]|nr:30S ribosome-binding factor RbfA [Bryobacterales bacterium]
MDTHRAERLSEAIREELSEIIGYETDDPRLLTVTVTEVHLSPDLRRARISVNVGNVTDQQEPMRALEAARHYLRRELASRLEIYRIPDLHFELDTNVTPAKVDFLLRRIRKGRPREADSAGPDGGEKKTF